MTRRTATIVLVALALAAAACSGDDGEDDRTGPAEGNVIDAPTGAMTDLTARRATRMAIAGLLQVGADEQVQVEATATPAGDGPTVEVPRTAQALARHRIPVVGLRARTTYDIAVRAIGDDGSVVGQGTIELTTGALPRWMPDFRVDVAEPDRMAPGYTLFDVQRWGIEVPEGQPPGALIIVDETGEVVWYHTNSAGAGDARMTQDGNLINLYAPFGFEEVDLLGRRVQTWIWGNADNQRPDGPTIIDSPNYDLISFHHEAAPQPDGDILAFSRYHLDLTPAEQEAICPGDVPFGIREDLVMEFTRDGEILNEWSLADIVDPADVPGRQLCGYGSENYRDWAHGNGAVLDEAGNRVIVTARHIDLLFAFRYEDDAEGPSGELLWSIGPDGTLPLDGEPSYGLHAPQLAPDGTILVLDNGNDRPGTPQPYSRAVRYEVDDSSPDPADWTARQVWEYRTGDLERDGPLYSDFLGDADLLANDNVLAGFGGINQNEPPARGRIIEVVPRGASGGDIVFDLSLPDHWVSYRSERLPALYVGPRWVTD